MPERIQRHNVKGWRLPAGAVYVGRPSKWGNPFDLRREAHCWTAIAHGFRADRRGRMAASVVMFRAWIERGQPFTVDCGFTCESRGESFRVDSSPTIEAPAPPSLDEIRRELRGQDLCCWCPLAYPDGTPHPCHADVLLAISNGWTDANV